MTELEKLQRRNFRCIAPLRQQKPSASEKQLLFRSANLDASDQATVDYLRQQLGIKTIVDLRNYNVAKEPLTSAYKPVTVGQFQKDKKSSDAKENDAYRVFVPFLNFNFFVAVAKRAPYSDYPVILASAYRYFVLNDTSALRSINTVAFRTNGSLGIYQTYLDFAVTSQKELKTVVEILSQPENLPAMICCQVGKDRTGFASAMVLYILGYSLEEIIDDYHESENGLQHELPKLIDELKDLFGVDESYAMAPKEYMQRFLQWIKETYGSIDNYLLEAGIDENLRARLRKTLRSENNQ